MFKTIKIFVFEMALYMNHESEPRPVRPTPYLFTLTGQRCTQLTALTVLGGTLLYVGIDFSDANRVPVFYSSTYETVKLGDVPIQALTLAFLAMAMMDHAWRSMKLIFYASNESPPEVPDVDHIRWFQYFFSASTMCWQMAMIQGILDVTAGLGIAFLIATTMLFGYLQDRETAENPYGSGYRSISVKPAQPYIIFYLGCIPYLFAYGLLFTQLGFLHQHTSRKPPDFVWAVLFTQFMLMNLFALNQYLYIRQWGHSIHCLTRVGLLKYDYSYANMEWNRMAYGLGYDILSVTAKVLLALLVHQSTKGAPLKEMFYTI